LEDSESTTAVTKSRKPFDELGEEMLAQRDGPIAEAEARPRKRGWRVLREVAETILLTVVIFAVINTLTGRFRVEGPSMNPNLAEGQYLIINRIVYKLHPPGRGDIIVFHHPRNGDRDLIKRVIGLPGETVEVRQGRVYIDGNLLEEPYVLYQGRYAAYHELGPDEFFILGDNRPNSDDSHNWGVLTGDKIVGKAWISYWPPSDWGGVPHHSYPDGPTPQGRGTEENASSRARGG
jgi:signal peptidase I